MTSNAFDKSTFRTWARIRLRDNAAYKAGWSRRIWDRLDRDFAISERLSSGNCMIYMDFGNEVQTAAFVWTRLGAYGKVPLAVPFCHGDEIQAWRIFSPNDLESGVFGIPEPAAAVRAEPNRRVPPESLDFVLLPGLAFDEAGNRLGRGKGYYDRFLTRLRPETPVVALAFECQIFDRIPTDKHDRPVSAIVTESRVLNFSRQLPTPSVGTEKNVTPFAPTS